MPCVHDEYKNVFIRKYCIVLFLKLRVMNPFKIENFYT